MTVLTRKACNAPVKHRAGFGPLIVAGLAVFTLATPATAQSTKVRLGYQYSLWGAPAVVALELTCSRRTASRSRPSASVPARTRATGSCPTIWMWRR